MIAYHRGLAVAITQCLTHPAGAMIAVQATSESLRSLLEDQNLKHVQDHLTIACYNSSANFTVSG